MTAVIHGGSIVRIHNLHIRTDGDEWIVGRIEVGDFAAVPLVGVRAIELLRDGYRVDECRDRLRAAGLGDVDVSGFVSELTSLGFVAAVDGQKLEASPSVQATFPWLRPSYVRWTQSLVAYIAVGVLIAAGLAVAVTHTELFPSPDALLWSSSGSIVLLGQTALFWILIFLHELAHLVTARAAGVPGKIRLSTRLQFLIAQTDVTGMWAADRRQRMTVYLAGMALDASIASAATIALAATSPVATVHRFASVILLTEVLLLAPQFLIFLRTDLYFVLQELMACRSLHADGSAYVRHITARILSSTAPPDDPSRNLPRRERRAVRGYAVLLVMGVAACLGVAVGVSLPAALHFARQAATAFSVGSTWPQIADAVVVILVLVGIQLLWCRLWWRTHGPRLRQWSAGASRKGHFP